MSKDDFVTLKEAAEISGYSSDYVGQLIRQGKLSGKQVYSNIAWVTSRRDLEAYIRRVDGKKGEGLVDKLADKSQQFARLTLLQLDPFRVYKYVVNLGLIMAVLIMIVVFYVFSTAIDNRIEQKALQSANLGQINY